MTGGADRFSKVGESDPVVLKQPIAAPYAWRAAELARDDWALPIPGQALAELDHVARALADYDGDIEALDPNDYAFEAVADMMAEVQKRLDHGLGFTVLDRLPVEHWGEMASKAVGWILTSMLGPVVMQKTDGTRLYEVKDSGAKLGYGVRRSITNLDQDFHTDGGWLADAPEITTLVCLRSARAGGLSRVASLATAHNEMLERNPGLLARLYREFWWDRQAEHAPEEAKSSRHPVFAWNGEKLTVRHYVDYVRKGYQLLGEPLDGEGDAALAAMKAIVDMPENWIEFRLEPGQIEYVNNHLLAHARTAFEDDDSNSADSNGGRYLLRLWNRREGGIAFEPDAVPTPIQLPELNGSEGGRPEDSRPQVSQPEVTG